MNYDVNSLISSNIEIPPLVLITAVLVLIPAFSHHYSVKYLRNMTNSNFSRAPFAPSIELFSLAWLFLSALMAFCYNRTRKVIFLVLMCFNLFWVISYAFLEEPALGLFVLLCNFIFAGYILVTAVHDFVRACVIVYMIYLCYSIYLNFYALMHNS